MLTMVGDPTNDGKSATFTGEVEAYGNGNQPANYEIGTNPLEGTEATLVHAAMGENDYYIMDDGSFNFIYPYAANVETLMTRGLRVTGSYQNGGYSLNSVYPIINCSLSGLAPSTEYIATLRYPSSNGYYPKGYGIFTTNASGAGTVAFNANDSGTQDWDIEIKQGSTTVGTIDLGNRELATKVYNVSRYWNGVAFYNPTTALTMEALTAGTIVVNNPRKGMQYSVNGGEKNELTATKTISGLQVGDKVQFYGDGTNIKTYYANLNDYTKIAGGTAEVKVYGNIMSLVDETGFATATTLTGSNAFNSLFINNTTLKDASGLLLPATTLADHCYKNMFQDCTNLSTAPALPAETLADYCYYYMFKNCKNLTTAPALSAESLAEYCYGGMFFGCSSLSAAPELPAMILAGGCYYNLFYGCSSLTTAPMLCATTLVYRCYMNMFYDCSNLNSVTCLATDISAKECTKDWLYGVASSGTFTKAASMTNWSPGDSGIPDGWTRVNSQ